MNHMKFTSFSYFLFYLSAAYGQNSAFVGFNSTMSGRNIGINYSIPKGDNNFTFGLRVNIIKLHHNDDQSKVFVKRLYATKPLHYFGLNFCFERNILKNWQKLKPFVFYDLQYSYSTTRNRWFFPYYYYVEEDLVLHREYIENFGPFHWVENNLGIGFNVDINDKFYMKQKLGYGRTLVLGYDDELLGKMFNWFSSEFGGHFSVSIGYKF